MNHTILEGVDGSEWVKNGAEKASGPAPTSVTESDKWCTKVFVGYYDTN
jgi:hypothetical protein